MKKENENGPERKKNGENFYNNGPKGLGLLWAT